MSSKFPQQTDKIASVTGTALAATEDTLEGILYALKVTGATGTLTLTIVSGVITVAALT